MKFDTLTLDSVRHRAQRAIAREVAMRMELDVWVDEFVDGLVASLETSVLQERLADETVELEFVGVWTLPSPSTPWDFFKAQHQGAWWLRWARPVRASLTRSGTVRRKAKVRNQQFAAFPMSPIRTPEKQRGPVVVRAETTEVLGYV